MRGPRAYLRQLIEAAVRQVFEYPVTKRTIDAATERHWIVKAEASGHPLLRRGQKFYSQNDEDGIIAAIMERIGRTTGVFVEFGCGDGLENNTLHLLMQGWRGVWIGADALEVRVPQASNRLRFEQDWVTRENCVAIVRRGLDAIGVQEPDLISIDLDGNDWHIAKALLEAGLAPDVVVVEYNAKLPPPIRFTIDYDARFTWSGGDYFGASLQTHVDLLGAHGYALVCCNVTGANAFFVAARHLASFGDLPSDPSRLFMPSDYNWFVTSGHRTDPRLVEHFLRSSPERPG